MPRLTARLCVLACLAAAIAPALADEIGVEHSVVRIVNYSQRANWYAPWDVDRLVESSGSGFVIEGGLVMTNAHVISDSRLLLLLKHNDPEPYVAEVVHVAHDCDLALIRPAEPSALDGVPPLPFGGMPELSSTVDTLGYPSGGTRVSSTRGIVSRIEGQLYLHSGIDRHLTVQTDAAINPGNSGGPVIQDGRVVGVAFQAHLDLQSVGFFIPTEVIGRFLLDIRDGRYDGYPELGIATAGLENPAARARLGLAPGESGVRVYSVYHGTSAEHVIQEGDVILLVDGRPVANDGTVADGDSRIPFGLLVDRKQIGETASVRLLRDGERIDLEVTLGGFAAAASQGNAYDRSPRYWIYGGLVFVALNREVLKTFGADWYATADNALLYEFLLRPQFEPELLTQERVVLLRRLKHRVNADMAWYRNQVVEQVNGKPISRLEDLVEALERHAGDYHVIEFSNYRRIGVLDRRAADEAHTEILQRYGIQTRGNL